MASFPRQSLALAATFGLLLTSACHKSGPQSDSAGNGSRRGDDQIQPVEVTTVQRRDLVESLDLVGSLAPNESADIRSEIAGHVRAIHFDEGKHVEKGQVLLKIDDAELLAQLAQAEARFKLAELNLQRAGNLRQTLTNTQADYDRAYSEHATIKAELELLRVRLEKTEIKAPFAGVAGARAISPGDYVNTASTITTINDLSRLKVEFQAPERYLAKVRPGTGFSVRLRDPDSDRLVRGEVYFVNPVINRDTRSSEVKGYLGDPPPSLQAGMFVNIELVLEVRRGTLTVPEGSILASSEGVQVIAVQERDGGPVAEFIPVRLGLRTRGLVEVSAVTGRLDEGLPVVASGVGALVLYPGARLDPQPLRAEFKTGE